jgi:hypothetical protein
VWLLSPKSTLALDCTYTPFWVLAWVVWSATSCGRVWERVLRLRVAFIAEQGNTTMAANGRKWQRDMCRAD